MRGLLSSLVYLALCGVPCHAEVDLVGLPPTATWPGATQPGALRLACSTSLESLQRFFLEEQLPFRDGLVRRETGRACHVFYRPTLRGFRAAPDDDPVSEIVFDSSQLLFLTAFDENRGEPVGAMREVLSRVQRPLDVGILLHRVHDPATYDQAAERNFGQLPHRVQLRERGLGKRFWWIQDCLKAGRSARGETLLVPHRIFEGQRELGESFDPLLESLSKEDRAVRSRLSWEGGDLQFARDPKDPQKLILFYGNSAMAYWGDALTPGDFEYVLSLEFGADRAVDLSGLAPHVDYFVSFLADTRTALVSVPRSGDHELARAAVDGLLRRFVGDEPKALVELRQSLAGAPDTQRVRAAIEVARRRQGHWSFELDPALGPRIQALVRETCPEAQDCSGGPNQLRMIQADPALYGEWVHAVQHAKDEQAIIAAHLDLVESQLERVPTDVRRRTEDKIAELQALGFRVIRVPAYRVDLLQGRDWPGISYVNCLVIDQQIFLPQFGLGEVEERLVAELSMQLPAGYSIVPIFAKRVLIRNGGLHCLAGIIRSR